MCERCKPKVKTRIGRYWENLKHKRDVLPPMVLPDNHHSRLQTEAMQILAKEEQADSEVATRSYDLAVKICKAKVEEISKSCRMLNRKYRDKHFDLLTDPNFCHYGFPKPCGMSDCDEWHYGNHVPPRIAVRRVPDIFEHPEFFKDGATASDIQQGFNGDCWFLAGVATVTNVPELIKRICVARDETVGVYGFVFQRDGEWISTVIDDQLPMQYREKKYTELVDSDGPFAKIYEKAMRGSNCLYYAKCADDNETWLPLLEKAYAKAHGDYEALSGGWTGEAVEDLTGGVASTVRCSDIMDRDRFWKEELSQVNKIFLMGASTDVDETGIIGMHAYSILTAKEVKGKRFVKVRNPWGKTEWKGPWSDGSSEWTVEWIQALEHTFGDDGTFWMSYEDFLYRFEYIDRVRLFDNTWNITQKWVSVNPTWIQAYSATRFQVILKKRSNVVFLLSQLDDRYFNGLKGRYGFQLKFRVQNARGSKEVVAQNINEDWMRRSVNAEIELEPGTYHVLFKVDVSRDDRALDLRTMVEEYSKRSRAKFLQLGLSHDMAYAKGFAEVERRKKLREERQKRLAKIQEENRKRFEAVEKIKQAQKEAEEKRKNEEEARKAKWAKMVSTGTGPDIEEAKDNAEDDAKDETKVAEKGGSEALNKEASDSVEREAEDEESGSGSDTPAEEDFEQVEHKNEEPQKEDTLRIRPTLRHANSQPEGNRTVQKGVRFGLNESHEPESPYEEEYYDYHHEGVDRGSGLGYPMAHVNPSSPANPEPPAPNPPSAPTTDTEEEGDEEDMWEPVAVIGLRVYSQDPDCTIEVLHPESSAGDKLDIDDEQRDAADLGTQVVKDDHTITQLAIKRSLTFS